MARRGSVLVAPFHPELTDDPAVHEYFCAIVRKARVGVRAAAEGEASLRKGVRAAADGRPARGTCRPRGPPRRPNRPSAPGEPAGRPPPRAPPPWGGGPRPP